jgi:hypothetical protein
MDEYYQHIEMCLLHTGIQEDEESLMTHFFVGLDKSTANKADITNYSNIT